MSSGYSPQLSAPTTAVDQTARSEIDTVRVSNWWGLITGLSTLGFTGLYTWHHYKGQPSANSSTKVTGIVAGALSLMLVIQLALTIAELAIDPS